MVPGHTSIKPLVGRIKGWDTEVDDPEPADGPVAAQRLDQNRHERANGDEFTVEFQMALAFENEIDLRVFPVVVDARILLNVHDMDGSRVVCRQGERSFGKPTRALYRLNIVKMG